MMDQQHRALPTAYLMSVEIYETTYCLLAKALNEMHLSKHSDLKCQQKMSTWISTRGKLTVLKHS